MENNEKIKLESYYQELQKAFEELDSVKSDAAESSVKSAISIRGLDEEKRNLENQIKRLEKKIKETIKKIPKDTSNVNVIKISEDFINKAGLKREEKKSNIKEKINSG